MKNEKEFPFLFSSKRLPNFNDGDKILANGREFILKYHIEWDSYMNDYLKLRYIPSIAF